MVSDRSSNRKKVERIMNHMESEGFMSDKDSLHSVAKQSDATVKQTKRFYKGEVLLREMMVIQSAQIGIHWPIIVLVIIRVFFPIIVSFYDHNFTTDFYWYEYVFKLMYILVNILCHSINLL